MTTAEEHTTKRRHYGWRTRSKDLSFWLTALGMIGLGCLLGVFWAALGTCR